MIPFAGIPAPTTARMSAAIVAHSKQMRARKSIFLKG